MEERLPSTHKALGSALGLILELRKVGGGGDTKERSLALSSDHQQCFPAPRQRKGALWTITTW